MRAPVSRARNVGYWYDAEAIETYKDRDWFQDWGTVTNPQWLANGEGPQLLIRPNVTSTLYTFGGLINQPGSALHRLMFLGDGSAVPFVLGDPAVVGGGTHSHSGGIGDNIERDRAAERSRSHTSKRLS